MSEQRFDSEFRRGLEDLFALRRDVRRFRTTPVPEDDLQWILRAGHQAPSVGLSQPWRFILVDSAAARATVAANFEAENERCARMYGPTRMQRYRQLKLAGLREAPIHLLVCCETDPQRGSELGRRTQPETVAFSAVCAIQNVWLAARSLGIGVGWVSILEPAELRGALDVPSTWQWIGYLCIGYPSFTEDDQPELERAGWEHRVPLSEVIVRR